MPLFAWFYCFSSVWIWILSICIYWIYLFLIQKSFSFSPLVFSPAQLLPLSLFLFLPLRSAQQPARYPSRGPIRLPLSSLFLSPRWKRRRNGTARQRNVTNRDLLCFYKNSDPLCFYFHKNNGRYVKIFGEKKAFWVEIFSIYQKIGLHLLSSNLPG